MKIAAGSLDRLDSTAAAVQRTFRFSSSSGFDRSATSICRFSAKEIALFTSPWISAPLKFFVLAASGRKPVSQDVKDYMMTHTTNPPTFKTTISPFSNIDEIETAYIQSCWVFNILYIITFYYISYSAGLLILHYISSAFHIYYIGSCCNTTSGAIYFIGSCCNTTSGAKIEHLTLTCELPEVHILCKEGVLRHLVGVDLQMTHQEQ